MVKKARGWLSFRECLIIEQAEVARGINRKNRDIVGRVDALKKDTERKGLRIIRDLYRYITEDNRGAGLLSRVEIDPRVAVGDGVRYYHLKGLGKDGSVKALIVGNNNKQDSDPLFDWIHLYLNPKLGENGLGDSKSIQVDMSSALVPALDKRVQVFQKVIRKLGAQEDELGKLDQEFKEGHYSSEHVRQLADFLSIPEEKRQYPRTLREAIAYKGLDPKKVKAFKDIQIRKH